MARPGVAGMTRCAGPRVSFMRQSSSADDPTHRRSPVSWTPSRTVDRHLVVGRSLDDRAESMAARVDRPRRAARRGRACRCSTRHLHPPDDEALDLVHVEALVDPGHQQRLGPSAWARTSRSSRACDLVGRHQQGEHAERGLRERLGARRRPSRARPRRPRPRSAPSRRRSSAGRRSATARSPRGRARPSRCAGCADPARPTVSPCARAASTSAAASPPSGPITSSRRAGCQPRGRQQRGQRRPAALPQAEREVGRLAERQPLGQRAAASRPRGSPRGRTAWPPRAATRCQRRARSRQRAASSRTIVRSQRAGRTRATPSSVAARTIASILSPLGTPWMSVTASGESATPAASASTVPVAASPTLSRRTV